MQSITLIQKTIVETKANCQCRNMFILSLISTLGIHLKIKLSIFYIVEFESTYIYT